MARKNLKKAGIVLISFSLIFGLFTRVFPVLYFTNFSGDQINDAYRTMAIWQGSWPTLGPGPAAWSGLSGDVYLPPLYYYLVFPFTIITPDLSAQAIPNALFSFLTVPALIICSYNFLDKKVEANRRIFLSALAGFWYSILFRNIVFSTGDSIAGNPVSIPFFLICFILLYNYLLKSKLSFVIEAICWISYGILLAVITNLHFSTLFIMPIVFLASIIFYISRKPRKIKSWFLPGIATISAFISLTPYWLGEIDRDWINTSRILALITTSSTDEDRALTFLQRLQAMAQAYISLGNDVYFIGESWKSLLISLLFLSVVLIVGITKFRGNMIIFGLLIGTWALFFYAYSSTNMGKTYDPIFYKALIYLAPIFLTISVLAYLEYSHSWHKILAIFIASSIFISTIINVKFHYNYISSRYGIPRIPNISDLAQVLEEIPANSTICSPAERYKNIRDDEYTDHFVTRRNFEFSSKCQPESYFIYPKYGSLGNYSKRSTKPLNQAFPNLNTDYSLYKENSFYYIYRFSPLTYGNLD